MNSPQPPTHFVYKLIPPRASFAGDMTESEAATMQEHAGYWTRLLDDGQVVAFGPVLDPAGLWGLAVVEAADEAEVRKLGDSDPAITSGLAAYEVFPMADAAVRPRP